MINVLLYVTFANSTFTMDVEKNDSVTKVTKNLYRM